MSETIFGTEEQETSKQSPESTSHKEEIDILDRKPLVDKILQLIELLSETKNTTTFALNGKWGSGKTFVLKMLEKELLPYEESGKYLVFHYNCWQYDYYDEPLIAIVSAMLDYIDNISHLFNTETRIKGKTALKFAKDTLLKIGASFIQNKIGFDPTSIVEEWNNAKKEVADEESAKLKFDELRTFNKTLAGVRKAINELAVEQTLIVIVDELDRCLPNYAIKVLERLHHIFSDTQNTIVILSVDREQLDTTVKTVFGEKTASEDYLRKFISFQIPLSFGDVKDSFFQKYASYFDMFEIYDRKVCKCFYDFFTTLFSGIDPRTQNELMARVEKLHSLLPSKKRRYEFACFEVLMICDNYFGVDFSYPWIDVTGSFDMLSGNREKLGFNNLVRLNKTLQNHAGQVVYNPSSKLYDLEYGFICDGGFACVLTSYCEGVYPHNVQILYEHPAIGPQKDEIAELLKIKELSELIE